MYTGGKENKGNREDEKAWQRERPKAEQLDKIAFDCVSRVLLFATYLTPVLPYLLAFSAGAMIYVVVEELIPESAEGEHSNIGTVGFAAGFVLMMILDVALG